MSDVVGGCPRDADFQRFFVEACRSELDDVGMGWGRKWGKRLRSDWLTAGTVDEAGYSVRYDKKPQMPHRSEWKRHSRKFVLMLSRTAFRNAWETSVL